LLALILSAGLYLRIANLSWGIPERHPFMGRFMEPLYPDEPNLVQQIRSMMSNPLSNAPFTYPPLDAQIAAFFAWMLRLTKASGLFLVARWISVIASVLTIGVTYLVGRFQSEQTGLIASAFLAFTMAAAREAHWANPESLCGLLIMLGLLFFCQSAQEFSIRNLSAAAICMGLAICAKYYGALFLHLPLVVIAVAGFRKHRSDTSFIYKVGLFYGIVLSVLLVMLVPYIAANKESFDATASYISGWLNRANGLYGTFPQPAAQPHYTPTILPIALGYPVYVFAIGGIVLSVVTRSRFGLLLLLGIVPFWAALEASHYRPIRFAVSLLPALCIFAAVVIDRTLSSRARLVRIGGGVVLGATLIYGFAYTLAFVNAFNEKKDVRFAIEDWIQRRNPGRTGIAMLAHNLTTDSIGFIKYTTIEHFNGQSFDLSAWQPAAIVVPRVFLEALKQCLELEAEGYVYSDADWWPIHRPTPETLALVRDLMQQRTYRMTRVFKNNAEFAGLKFKDDTLKFDYFWVTNLEVLLFERRN
jgi:hypothetical protein